MSKIIGFIKANLFITISVVLILAFLPTGFFFANGWNKSVHEEADKAYKSEKSKLTRKGSINYSLPAVLEGEEDLSESRAPNSAVTDFYAARKGEREDQVREVVERGTAFNQEGHAELVLGILPQAPDNKTQKRLGREMSELIVGTEANPSVYQRKLQRLNAGSPPDAESLLATIIDARDEQQKVYESENADGRMTPEQIKSLSNDMIARRMGEYIGRAKSLTFYCSMDSIVNSDSNVNARSKGAYSIVPGEAQVVSAIDESVVFTWLWDYWMISDVLEAAALANTDAQTGAMAVPVAPVKSIEMIRVSKLEVSEAVGAVTDTATDPTAGYLAGGSRGRGGSGGGQQASTPGSKGGPKASFTGRADGDAMSAFDVRTIDIVVVASSQDLPRFIDAIGKANYMTVTDVDLEQVDVWEDLGNGYYYGEDHVVRASITIESVWLRSWMTPIMPDQVKTALGIPLTNELEESDG